MLPCCVLKLCNQADCHLLLATLLCVSLLNMEGFSLGMCSYLPTSSTQIARFSASHFVHVQAVGQAHLEAMAMTGPWGRR